MDKRMSKEETERKNRKGIDTHTMAGPPQQDWTRPQSTHVAIYAIISAKLSQISVIA